MKRELYWGTYYSVETTVGTEVVPGDEVGRTMTARGDYFRNWLSGDPVDPDAEVEPALGWICRLTMPGYLDCSDWSAFADRAEAEKWLDQLEGKDE